MTLKNNNPEIDNHSTIARMSVWNKFLAAATCFPHIYAILVTPLALLGFAYLLVFPALAILGTGKIIQSLVFTPINQLDNQIDSIAVWLGVTLISTLITREISRIRFTTPEGIDISSTTASRLYKLLKSIKQQTSIPRIKRIIITEQLSLDILKTPKLPIPIWSTNTLVVGLPLMQCLSPEYFKCAMTRKLIQHSKHQHTLLKWLAQLRAIWAQYPGKLKHKSNKYSKVLYFFFKVYAPFYKFISIPIANYVELLADQETLSIVNDEDLLQTIEKVIVTKIYMEKQYWPKIKNMIHHDRINLIQPYSKLEQVLQKGLTPQLSKRWLDTLYCSPPTRVQPIPDLRSRMNNIGRSSVRIPETIQQTAAQYFLDSAYRDIISEVNQMWLLRSDHLYNKPVIKPAQFLQNSGYTKSTSRMNPELFN